jgi:sugar/nucleoside kinase (ribokinase family)
MIDSEFSQHEDVLMSMRGEKRPFDVVTFGDLGVDLIVTGSDVAPEFGQVEKLVGDYMVEMGGSCSLFACQAAKLGLRTAILGVVGRDSFGELVLARLNECGVDTSSVRVDPDLKTGMGVALCQGDDRAILTYMGTFNALKPVDVTDGFLAQARHLHHGSYYLHTGLRPGIPEIFRRARRLGLTISLDTNWDPEEEWRAGLDEALPLVDVFLPNEPELSNITGHSSVEEAVAALADLGVKQVVLKKGAKGAAVFAGKEVFEQAVTPVSGGDSIGAGDSLDAGFLAGWLRGLGLMRALQIGCFCGRSVAGKVGGLAGQPLWDEVMKGE